METVNIRIKSKKYNDKTILRDIDASYPLSGIHGILGANGSGKTTLFNCMMGFTGFEGKRAFSDTAKVGFLPAELYMYPHITGNEFISFYLSAKATKPNEDEKKRYNKLFELPLNDYAASYSTGMLKKLYLMALLLQHNKVLLLDEPFNGLDYVSTLFLTSILKNLREQGYTIFVASHAIEHLISFCDTLSIVKNGGIACYTSPNEIARQYGLLKQEAEDSIKEAFTKAL